MADVRLNTVTGSRATTLPSKSISPEDSGPFSVRSICNMFCPRTTPSDKASGSTADQQFRHYRDPLGQVISSHWTLEQCMSTLD